MLACLSGPTVSVSDCLSVVGASLGFSLSLFLSPSCLGLFSPGKVLLHSSLERKNKQTGYPQECKRYFGHIRNICVCGFRWLRGLSPHDKCPLFVVFCFFCTLSTKGYTLSHRHTNAHTHIYIHGDLKAFPSLEHEQAFSAAALSCVLETEVRYRVPCGGDERGFLSLGKTAERSGPRPARGPTITG